MKDESLTTTAGTPPSLNSRLRVPIQRLTAARWLWMSLLIFGVSRLAVVVAAYAGAILFPTASDPPPYHLRPPDNLLLDVLGSRWDTGFYVSIVEQGYVAEGVPLPSVPFFPLLPMLMAAVRPFVGGDAVVAGVAVANVALLLATFFFYRLAQLSWGDKVADRATWYLLIFPAAFFGSAIYTESLFLLCAVASLYFARTNRWLQAGLFALAATLSRLVGLIVVPMLLLEWVQQRQQRPAGEPCPSWLALLAPLVAPLGTLSYMAYLGRRFGDPLAFAHASEAWGREPQPPAEMIQNLLTRPAGGWGAAVLAGNINWNDWFDFLIVLFFLVLSFVLIYEHRWSEGIFVWTGVMLAFSSGLLMSQRRYMWVLFPVSILLGRWGARPWVDKLVTAVSLILLGIFTALFANGFWVG